MHGEGAGPRMGVGEISGGQAADQLAKADSMDSKVGTRVGGSEGSAARIAMKEKMGWLRVSIVRSKGWPKAALEGDGLGEWVGHGEAAVGSLSPGIGSMEVVDRMVRAYNLSTGLNEESDAQVGLELRLTSESDQSSHSVHVLCPCLRLF